MSTWPDKFVIGLTGNIATGKSVVRRMRAYGMFHLGTGNYWEPFLSMGSLERSDERLAG